MSGPKSDKIWADAIHMAVKRYHEEEDETGKVKKQRYLNLLADNLVQAGVKGDIQAIKEVGDRLDGKPAQAIDQTIRDERNIPDRTNAELIEEAAGLIGEIEGDRPRGRRKRASANGSSDLH